MIDRAYTVKELDDLRAACRTRWLYGTTKPPRAGFGCSRQFGEGELERAVEELVRTHMMAGHLAKDIYDADRGESKESQ